MKITVSKCFDRGQKVTEVGAALAYAEYQSRRMAKVGRESLKDVVAGLNSAAAAADRLQKALKGKDRTCVGRFAQEIRSTNGRIQRKWAEGLRSGDIVEIQQGTSSLRKKVIGLWQEIRKPCGG